MAIIGATTGAYKISHSLANQYNKPAVARIACGSILFLTFIIASLFQGPLSDVGIPNWDTFNEFKYAISDEVPFPPKKSLFCFL